MVLLSDHDAQRGQIDRNIDSIHICMHAIATSTVYSSIDRDVADLDISIIDHDREDRIKNTSTEIVYNSFNSIHRKQLEN